MQGQEICSMLPSRLAAIVRRYDSDWENVQEIRIRQGRRMTLRAAAEACGIPKSTFRDAALRAEMAVIRTGTK